LIQEIKDIEATKKKGGKSKKKESKKRELKVTAINLINLVGNINASSKEQHQQEKNSAFLERLLEKALKKIKDQIK